MVNWQQLISGTSTMRHCPCGVVVLCGVSVFWSTVFSGTKVRPVQRPCSTATQTRLWCLVWRNSSHLSQVFARCRVLWWSLTVQHAAGSPQVCRCHTATWWWSTVLTRQRTSACVLTGCLSGCVLASCSCVLARWQCITVIKAGRLVPTGVSMAGVLVRLSRKLR